MLRNSWRKQSPLCWAKWKCAQPYSLHFWQCHSPTDWLCSPCLARMQAKLQFMGSNGGVTLLLLSHKGFCIAIWTRDGLQWWLHGSGAFIIFIITIIIVIKDWRCCKISEVVLCMVWHLAGKLHNCPNKILLQTNTSSVHSCLKTVFVNLNMNALHLFWYLCLQKDMHVNTKPSVAEGESSWFCGYCPLSSPVYGQGTGFAQPLLGDVPNERLCNNGCPTVRQLTVCNTHWLDSLTTLVNGVLATRVDLGTGQSRSSDSFFPFVCSRTVFSEQPTPKGQFLPLLLLLCSFPVIVPSALELSH